MQLATDDNGAGRAQVHGVAGLLVLSCASCVVVDSHAGFITPVAEREHGFAIVGEHFLDAPSALDATVVLHDHARRVEVDQPVLEHVREAGLPQAQFIGHVLQVAVAAFLTARAEVVALGKHHFNDGIAGVLQFVGGGLDHHAVLDGLCAGRTRRTVDLAGADPAGAQRRLDVLEIAQAGNENVILVGYLHQVTAGGGLDFLAIDGDGDLARQLLALPLVFSLLCSWMIPQPGLTAEAVVLADGVFQAEAFAEPFGILIDDACKIFGEFILGHQQGIGRCFAQATPAGQFHDLLPMTGHLQHPMDAPVLPRTGQVFSPG